MKQIILRYGLLSGAVGAALMLCSAMYYRSATSYENGQYFGYAGILLSMLFVYFGVRAYREQVNGGVLTFGKGFQVGLIIAIVSCLCYVITWLVVYETIIPDFMDKFIAQSLDKMRSSGAAQAEIDKFSAEMAGYKEMYKNPLIRFGLTFLEPFPMGFLVSLISAIALRKRAV